MPRIMSGRRSIFKVSVNPRHSHSIISEARNVLFLFDDLSRRAQFTVNFTVKQIRFIAIDGDRSGEFLPAGSC
jgi:hypothetical protein